MKYVRTIFDTRFLDPSLGTDVAFRTKLCAIVLMDSSPRPSFNQHEEVPYSE